MAQPAGFAAQDNRTDMGIPVFWASANLDPPWQFKIWFEHFLMAVTVKENVNPEIILEEPKDILEEPPPRPETPRDGENEDARNARILRDKLAMDRVVLENEERKTRGPRVRHNVFYNEVQKKLVSRLFLSLGTEGKKRFLQKNPHAEISKMTFKEITDLAEVSFQKVKCVTYERYKLFTRMQESGESLESFHAALTAQAARSELGALENEIVRDLFISKMKNMTLQDTLTFETLDPEEVLKRAIKFEHSKLTTMAFQKTNTAATGGSSNNYISGVRIKQERVMAVRNLAGTNKTPNRRESNKRQNNNKNQNTKTKPCNRCGRTFEQGHLKNCPAMGKTCKHCGKPNHFAKMCRSQQVSEVAEDSEGSVEECDQISEGVGSCSEFEVKSIQTYQPENERVSKYVKDRINEMRDKPNGKMVRVQKIDSIRDPTLNRVKSLKAMVRIDNQIIQLTVDTGSPVSFLNWATTKEIMEKSNKVRFIPYDKLNLQTKFVDYNKQPISILGALKTNLRSAGWEVRGATSLVSERKTRCIMGLDLQGQVGIVTTQKPAPKELTRFDVLMCEQSEGWIEKFFTQFKNLFERQGISKNHIVS